MNTNKREARNSIQLDSIEIILRSMIGEGGQGTIFSARNVADDSSIVAKLVDTSTILKKINFRAEKEAVELIKPKKLEYLCDMYEYCEKDDNGYVLMKRYNCDLFDFAVVLDSTYCHVQRTIEDLLRCISITVNTGSFLSCLRIISCLRPEPATCLREFKTLLPV